MTDSQELIELRQELASFIEANNLPTPNIQYLKDSIKWMAFLSGKMFSDFHRTESDCIRAIIKQFKDEIEEL